MSRQRPLYLRPAVPVAIIVLVHAADSGAGWPRWKGRRQPAGSDNIHCLSEEAAHSLRTGLSQQVSNGAVLEATLRPTHFEMVETEDEETLNITRQMELHASGKALLERLSRRRGNTAGPVIYVEASHDPAFIGSASAIKAENDRVDQLRVALVEDYLRNGLGYASPTVVVIDVPAAGMEGVEGSAAFNQGLRSFTSTIPPRQLNRFSGPAPQ